VRCAGEKVKKWSGANCFRKIRGAVVPVEGLREDWTKAKGGKGRAWFAIEGKEGRDRVGRVGSGRSDPRPPLSKTTGRAKRRTGMVVSLSGLTESETQMGAVIIK
jgi:hypothetical protein